MFHTISDNEILVGFYRWQTVWLEYKMAVKIHCFKLASYSAWNWILSRIE